MTRSRVGALSFPLAALVASCAAGPDPGPERKTLPTEVASPRADKAKYVLPIKDAAIPQEERLLPNGRRIYRGGIHEGIDFYHKTGGTRIVCDEPVVAARTGWIVRADHDWRLMDSEEYKRHTDVLKKGTDPANDEARLDRLRGRQVWIRSDDGVVLRYCHLNSVAPHIKTGSMIAAGVMLGYVGNSGTRASVVGPRKNCHLHFEVRLSSGKYLGQGHSPARARSLYAKLFGVD